MVSRNKIGYEFNPYRREVMGALCLTKLSGTDFRVILLLLAQTDGYRRTEDRIKPAFFEEKTGLSKANVRRTISRLHGWHMISKQGQFYTVLPPGQWNKEAFTEYQGRFNIEALSAINGEGERFKSEAPGASKLKHPEAKSEAVSASSKENPSKENPSKEPSTKVEGGKPQTPKVEDKPPDPLAAQTPSSKYLFEKTSRKRWKNLVQKEEFEKVEAQVGEARMKEAIDWALLSGISNIKSMLTAAKKGGRHDAGKGKEQGRGSDSHQRGAGEGFKVIESGPDEANDGEED